MKLGPSPEFTANINVLKKWRGDVASDVVAVKHDNNVPLVEVTLNGSVVREMTVDRKIRLVYPARRALSHAAQAFLEIVQK